MSARYRFEQFFAMRRLPQFQHNVAFSPDGSEVAYATDTSGQYDLWRHGVRGCPRQLTTFEEQAVRNLTWLPDGSFVFFSDRQGNEKWQLYRLPGEGGWPERLTRHDDVQYQWSPEAVSRDGRLYAYGGNERDRASVDLFARDLASGETRTLFAGEGWFSFGGWSPDCGRILVAEFLGNADQNVHLVDLRSGERRNLTPHKGEMVNLAAGFTGEGNGVYLVTDRGRETRWLGVLDLASGKPAPIERGGWDVEAVARTPDGSRLAWTVNEDGYSVIRVRDERTRRKLRIPEPPRGATFEIALGPDGRRLAAKHTHSARPPEIYVTDLGRGAGWTQLTDSFLGGIPETELVTPELVRFRSAVADALELPAFLYRPRDASAERPVPAVLSIHGGPDYQERPWYSALYQYLLHRGVAILAPNARGSTGYGRRYQKLIHRDWGGKELGDFEACARYLLSLPWVDPQRLAVYGGSFGGFATLECVCRLPQYWAAAVEWFGPSNLVTFGKAVPPHWKRFMERWMGDPETEADFLMSRSPITYVDHARCPLLVIQGAQDPRVVKDESDQMVARLRSLGREVEYLVFEDEGHGMTKRRNQLAAFRATADFFLRKFGLGGVEAA